MHLIWSVLGLIHMDLDFFTFFLSKGCIIINVRWKNKKYNYAIHIHQFKSTDWKHIMSMNSLHGPRIMMVEFWTSMCD